MIDEHTHSENGSGPADNGWMKEAFRKWDAGQPADRWDELDESLSLQSVWNRVEQSFDAEDSDSWIRASHTAWDAGVPSGNWAALSASLDATDISRDGWMRNAHQGWDAGSPADGWKKMDEALSLEKVWTDLGHSLDGRGRFRLNWIAVAASVIAVLLAGTLNDMPVYKADNLTAADFPANISSGTTVVKPSDQDATAIVVDESTPVVQNAFVSQIFSVENAIPAQSPRRVNAEANVPANLAEKPAEKPVNHNPVSPADDKVADYPGVLNFRFLSGEEKSLQPLTFPKVKLPYHHWTLRVGVQVAFLPEKNRSELTSALPGLGMTSDLSFRHRVRSLQLSYAVGLCKYAQQTGKYVNGRYSKQHQQLNAMQLSAAVAWEYRRWMVFGGPFATKVLSGIEQKSNTITNVYNFNSLQLGVMGGLDYRLFVSRETGKRVSVGLQYQWIPRPLGQNASFANIQSVRLQCKFSF